MFQANDFVQLRSDDFVYIGQVIACNDTHVEFVTGDRMTIGTPINEVSKTSKPKGWQLDPIKQLEAPVIAKPKKVNHKKVPGGIITKALPVYVKMVQDLDGDLPARKDVINMLVDQFNMTAAGASTYASNLKKHYTGD